jgi:hypothetical protein
MRIAAVTASVLLLEAIALAQRPEVLVSSASVRLIRKPVPTHVVFVENLRVAWLAEWEFTLAPAARPDRPGTRSHYPRLDVPLGREDGPIAPARSPGGVRAFHLQSDDASPQVASLTLAVFTDGVVDGTLEAVTAFRNAQAALVTDLVAWQTVFNALPRTEPNALVMLRAGRDAARKNRPDDPSRIRSQVTQWLEGARPRGWVFNAAESLREAIPKRLSAAARYRDGAAAALQDRATLGTNLARFATARAASGQEQHLIALVENLRDQPLEAFDLDIYDGPDARYPSSGRGYDACGVGRAGAGTGRIARGETREIDLGSTNGAEDRPLPVVVIKLAIWADQSWEGNAEARADRLRRRAGTSSAHATCAGRTSID